MSVGFTRHCQRSGYFRFPRSERKTAIWSEKEKPEDNLSVLKKSDVSTQRVYIMTFIPKWITEVFF